MWDLCSNGVISVVGLITEEASLLLGLTVSKGDPPDRTHVLHLKNVFSKSKETSLKFGRSSQLMVRRFPTFKHLHGVEVPQNSSRRASSDQSSFLVLRRIKELNEPSG